VNLISSESYLKEKSKIFISNFTHKGDYNNFLTKYYKETWKNRAQDVSISFTSLKKI